MNIKHTILFVLLSLICGVVSAEERMVTYDTVTGKQKADTTPTIVGTITADGLTIDEDEKISFVQPIETETFHWDSVSHDFRLTDDLYLEDAHPGLVLSNVDGKVAYSIHFHYGTNYPFALFYGSIDSDNKFQITGTYPLMYATTDNVGFPRGEVYMTGGNVGIGTNSPATSGILDISSSSGALIVSRMTTSQRDALTAVDGMIIYNTTTNAFNFRENGSWVTK